jgi:hypothetical protein
VSWNYLGVLDRGDFYRIKSGWQGVPNAVGFRVLAFGNDPSDNFWLQYDCQGMGFL